jgi:hypothetical protein
MLESAATVGSLETSDVAKRAMAAESLEWNIETSPNRAAFRKLFPELVQLRDSRRADAAAASGGGSASSVSVAAGSDATGSIATAATTAPPPAAAGGGAPLGWVAMAIAGFVLLVAWLLSQR